MQNTKTPTDTWSENVIIQKEQRLFSPTTVRTLREDETVLITVTSYPDEITYTLDGYRTNLFTVLLLVSDAPAKRVIATEVRMKLNMTPDNKPQNLDKNMILEIEDMIQNKMPYGVIEHHLYKYGNDSPFINPQDFITLWLENRY